MRQFSKLLLVAFALCTGLLSLSAQAQSRVVARVGEFLTVNQPYVSGLYTLIFQSDGNLVVYRGTNYISQNQVWSTKTNGKGAQYAVLQNDGNFVIYKNLGDPNSALWTSNTAGTPRPGYTPTAAIMSDGRFTVNGYGGVFLSPLDPRAPPAPCTVATAYPVCIFAGTTTQWTSTVLACSPAEAMSIASQMGATFGACR